MSYDEIIMSELIKEYFNDFIEERKKVESINILLKNNLIVQSNDEIVEMINRTIADKFNKIDLSYDKISKWWNEYNDAIEELNNGFVNTLPLHDYYNQEFIEVKNIYNNELK